MSGFFEVRQLNVGDVVEFKEHSSNARFGVIIGGFGCSPDKTGSKIFAIFGHSPQAAKNHYRIFSYGSMLDDLILHRTGALQVSFKGEQFRGVTYRHPTRIVGHIYVNRKALRKWLPRMEKLPEYFEGSACLYCGTFLPTHDRAAYTMKRYRNLRTGGHIFHGSVGIWDVSIRCSKCGITYPLETLGLKIPAPEDVGDGVK